MDKVDFVGNLSFAHNYFPNRKKEFQVRAPICNYVVDKVIIC